MNSLLPYKMHKKIRKGCRTANRNGPSSKDGGWSFSSGGDQRVRGKNGYEYEDSMGNKRTTGRLHTRSSAINPIYAGGYRCCTWLGSWRRTFLHVVCDMTIASKEHAKFKQTDPDVASFDGGFGSAYLARQVGQKRARELFTGLVYSAEEGFQMAW